MIVGAADIRFADGRPKIDEPRQLTVVTPLTSDPIPVSWDCAEPAPFEVSQLSTELPPGATFEALPAAAGKAKSYADWTKSFSSWVRLAESARPLSEPVAGLVSARERIRRRLPRAVAAGGAGEA